MNVVLFFPTYRDIYRFIKVNHKCLDTIKGLKTNPMFCSSESFVSFFKRFQTDTFEVCGIYFCYNEWFEKAKCIKSPYFHPLIGYQEKILNVLPKVVSLDLFYEDTISDTINFFIKYAHRFKKLQSITGSIENLIKFFKQYTNNGENMFVQFPRLIFTSTSNNNFLQLNDQTVDLVNELTKYIRQNGETRIIVLFNTHTSNADLIKRMKGIEYRHRGFINNPTPYCLENYCSFDGSFLIQNTIEINQFNIIINKAYSNSEIISGIPGKSLLINPNQNISPWNIPESVKKVSLQYISSETQNSMVSLSLISDYLKTLKITECNYLRFKNQFPSLEHLIIHVCDSISFEIIDNMFPSLISITISSSYNISLSVSSPKLEEILLYFNEEIKICGKVPSSFSKLFIRQSKNCKLPEISFETLNLLIEESPHLEFLNESKQRISPMKYEGLSVEQSERLCNLLLYLPSELSINEMLNPSNHFIFRRFYSVSKSLKIVDNRVIKTKDFVDGNYQFYSQKFYLKDNKNLKMKIYDSNNELREIPASIRYFELTVSGYNIISIGIMRVGSYPFEGSRHLGWDQGSIGFHSDCGNLFNEGKVSEYGIPFGLNEDEVHTVGCGFDTINSQVFFTLDGKKYPSINAKWTDITAGFTVTDMDWVEINYGQRPFSFDLYQYYEQNQRICVIV
ncbi:SPRY domain containing protein [Entamoeba nuttalli P19]|uniref:SPRY domain containing protein n=2 Tax=Entamoeba nuttalli TaxID=412467 RepID=K2H200_ENTNP|nr:SPRY domain containing protein [Entamoeba nuttalli P19]EKE40302.1 SPRY domain containing protein [Entamoeba nuttalli P19]|eukprot:XP_008857366.1 SPRY domain containing protein [Entamoeba nuttalli P19]